MAIVLGLHIRFTRIIVLSKKSFLSAMELENHFDLILHVRTKRSYFLQLNRPRKMFCIFDQLLLPCLKNTICNLSYFVFMGCPYCVVYLLYVHNEQGYTTPIVIIFLRILLLFSTKTTFKEQTCYFPVFV